MNQKLELFSSKKGYLQIDVAFSLLVFVTIFFFAYIYTSNYIEDYTNYNHILLTQTDSELICKLLINSPGKPINWESNSNNAIFFGLKAINSNNLTSSKISSFQNIDYSQLKDKMYFENNLGIKITGLNSGTEYLNYGGFTSGLTGVISSNYVCYSNYNSEIVKVDVEVWR